MAKRHIEEFMMWAASHAILREKGGHLFIDPKLIGTEPWQYLYGTTGEKCTQKLLDRKYESTYKGWDWSQMSFARTTSGWVENGVMVCDCQGLEDCFSNSDTSAAGNYNKYCSDEYKGAIKDIVREYVYGEALFCGSTPSKINHVAWVIGLMDDGEPIILHERGLSHGCVIERLTNSGKTFRFRGLMDKRYTYTVFAENSSVEEEPIDAPVYRDLILASPMMRGDDVLKLQIRLSELGYSVGRIDGIFGNRTDAALRAYQSNANAVIHGIANKSTLFLLGLK